MKNKKMKKYIYIIAILFIAVFLYLTIITKMVFENNINSYLNKEGITNEEILEKKIYRNSKQGGYTAKIKLKKDPKYTYEFTLNGYNPSQYLDYRKINLSICDEKNVEFNLIKDNTKPVYFIK
ncbi:DUF3139 domain-containing protein [Helcococcus kunzii]|uniref:DUF3139 domain-containing protein n=1 Tax=Helcococcus kunzii TaxID=40091 RepID=UPI0038AA6193